MKVTLEIKDNKLIYSTEIGMSTHNGEVSAGVDAFQELLNIRKWLDRYTITEKPNAGDLLNEVREFIKRILIASGDIEAASRWREIQQAIEENAKP